MAGTPKSQAAANFLKLEAAKLAQRYGEMKGIRFGAETRVGNYGDALAGLGADLFAKRTEARDKQGNLLYGADGNPIINKEYGRGSEIASLVMQNIGDAAGGALRAYGWASQANEAANLAGAMADARNTQAQRGIMDSAKQAAKGMNLQNAARTAAMTDSAIANQSAFDMGMQSIGMSGIEGSANMERNLQYGKSNAEAAEQMQYDMMNAEAEGLANSMAKSFSDLSQRRAGAEAGAFSDYMNQYGANNAAQWAAESQADYKFTLEDMAEWEQAEVEAAGVQGAEEVSKEEAAAGQAAAGHPLANMNWDDGTRGYDKPPETMVVPPAAGAGSVDEMDLAELIRLRDKYKGGAANKFVAGGTVEDNGMTYNADAIQNRINLLLNNKARHGKGSTSVVGTAVGVR